jgi:transposase
MCDILVRMNKKFRRDAEIRRLYTVIYLMKGWDRDKICKELNIGRSTFFKYQQDMKWLLISKNGP